MKKLLLLGLLFMTSSLSADVDRFPIPTREELQQAKQVIEGYGKQEVFSLSYYQFFQFLWNRYVRGPSDNFHYYGCNPESLTPEEARQPAIILLHASSSNQGQWIPLLSAIENVPNHGPIFTFNFQDETDIEDLIDTIHYVAHLYFAAGASDVELELVGHSRGAIASTHYASDLDLWVENTTVKKVISIAGRLKNIEAPCESPHYAYCHDVLKRIDQIWENIEKTRGIFELYTIAAENDWLVPRKSVLIGEGEKHNAVVPDTGHVLIPYAQETHDLVIRWLFGDES